MATKKTTTRPGSVVGPPERDKFWDDVAVAYGIVFVPWKGDRGLVGIDQDYYDGNDLEAGDVVWRVTTQNPEWPTIAHGVKVGWYRFKHHEINARFHVAQVAENEVGIVAVEIGRGDQARAISSTALPVDRLLRAVIQGYGVVGRTYPPGAKYRVNGKNRTAKDYVTVREAWSADVAAYHAAELAGKRARGGWDSDEVLRKAMEAYMGANPGERIDEMMTTTNYSRDTCKKMPAKFKERWPDEFSDWKHKQKAGTE